MIESATGLVLRTRPLTESSLIVHWLTPDFGRIATVARGARRSKSPFLGRLDLFYLADFSFSRSRRTDLHTLREASVRNPHAALRESMPLLHQAACAAALIGQVTETETPLPGIFDLLRDFLDSICGQKPVPQMGLAFELKLLREIGLEPDWKGTNLTVGAKKIAAALAQREFSSCHGLKPASAQCAELRQFLDGFWVFHVGRLPRGRASAWMKFSHDVGLDSR